MKLLFITEYFPAKLSVDVHGGVEVRTFEIARRLARRHKVSVIASREYGKPKTQILAGVYVERVGPTRTYTTFGQFWLRLLFSMNAIWRGLNLDFDLVEGAGLIGWLPTYVISLIKNKKRTMVVADVVEAYTQATPFVTRQFLRMWQQFIFHKPWDAVICISHTIANKLAQLGVRKNVAVIYCGVDTGQIRKLLVTKKSQHISCVSRLVSYKRIADLILAVANVKQVVPQAKLSIVGVGDEDKKLKDLTTELSLRSTVRFHGAINEQYQVWRLIKRSSIFCLPSVVEGFGLATIEAMAAGVPVVLADLPINHEVTKDKGALFFRPTDKEDLAEKLITLFTDKPLYQKLAKEGSIIAASYSWQDISQQSEKLYENLCTH